MDPLLVSFLALPFNAGQLADLALRLKSLGTA